MKYLNCAVGMAVMAFCLVHATSTPYALASQEEAESVRGAGCYVDTGAPTSVCNGTCILGTGKVTCTAAMGVASGGFNVKSIKCSCNPAFSVVVFDGATACTTGTIDPPFPD